MSFVVLVGHRQANEPSDRFNLSLLQHEFEQRRRLAGAPAAVLRQVLHPGPGSNRRGIHTVPVFVANQEGPGHRLAPMQRQYGCSDGILYRAG